MWVDGGARERTREWEEKIRDKKRDTDRAEEAGGKEGGTRRRGQEERKH